MKQLISNNKARILSVASLILFVIAASVECSRLYTEGYTISELFMMLLWFIPIVITNIAFFLNKQRRINSFIALALGGQLGVSISMASGTDFVAPTFMRLALYQLPSIIVYFVIVGVMIIGLVFMLQKMFMSGLFASLIFCTGILVYSMWHFYALSADVYLFAIAYVLLIISVVFSLNEHTYESLEDSFEDFYKKYYKDTLNSTCRAIVEVYACDHIASDQYENATRYLTFFNYLENSDFKELYKSGVYGEKFVRSFASDIYTFVNENISTDEYSQKTKDFLSLLGSISVAGEDEINNKVLDLVLLLSDDIRWEYLKEYDISSLSPYPLNLLSNFANHPYTLDGISINSMEGFLQSLKYRRKSKQKAICLLTGNEAKKAGRKSICWRVFKHLHWNGKRIDRFSEEYTELIKRAYSQMSKENPDYCEILKSTEGYSLSHSIGKRFKDETVLTEEEFVYHLSTIRENLLNQDIAVEEGK